MILPWVSAGSGFGYTFTANGFRFWEGIVSLLALAGAGAIGAMFALGKPTQPWFVAAATGAAGLAALITLLAFFRALSALGFGLIISLIAALAAAGLGVYLILQNQTKGPQQGQYPPTPPRY